MIQSAHTALVAALVLAAACGTAQAAPAAAPVVLEGVVVTPQATYSASEWQARVAMRQARLAAVTLEPVIVTPQRNYTAAEWQQHRAGLAYAKGERRSGVSAWLNAVWKHFQFKRSPVEV